MEKKKSFPALKTERVDESQVPFKKCPHIEKSAVCHCSQEVICLVRKVSGHCSATNLS